MRGLKQVEPLHLLGDLETVPFRAVSSVFICVHLWLNSPSTAGSRFKGTDLELNLATSAAGSVRLEVQDANGKPLPGFGLQDAEELIGDRIALRARWKNHPALSASEGTAVRLRFVLKDADLYSFRFVRTERP